MEIGLRFDVLSDVVWVSGINGGGGEPCNVMQLQIKIFFWSNGPKLKDEHT